MSDDERNRDNDTDATPRDNGPEDAGDPVPADGETPADTATQPDTSHGPEPDRAPTRPTATAGGGASMIVGGVLAAAIGAAAALVFLPEGWRRGASLGLGERIAALEARPGADELRAALEPLETRLATLEDRIGSLAAPDLDPLEARIAALERAPGGVAEQDLNAAIGGLSQRLDRIEAGLDDQARAAVDAALTEARARIDARAQALSAREETVAEAQARIAARAALADLVAAAESGEPAPGALATLTDHLGTAPALDPLANGLPTLAGLREGFAPAARAALAGAEPPQDAALTDRLIGFLRSQTGARSLAPRAGGGTDAILSRAEAALRAGNLPGALAELDALAGDPAQAMADWRAQAETRLAALAALDDMQTRLTGSEG